MVATQHTIVVDTTRCNGCVACSKVCPTRAFRVRDDCAVLKQELCIDCGACIPVCPRQAIKARTSSRADLKRFRHTVAIPSMTVFAQFGGEVLPQQALQAFRGIGFDGFYDMSWMCEMVAGATDAWLADAPGPWPKISVTCPAIVRLIQSRYPDLLDNIIPIESPRELSAKMLRRTLPSQLGLEPEEIGIFYITPCTSIMNSFLSPVGLERSYFDGALSISEVYGPLLKAMREPSPSDTEEPVSCRGLLWAMTGGHVNGMRNRNTMRVTGLHDVAYVFDRIEAGRFQSIDFIEVYICPDGCVSGCLTVEGRYMAQRSIQRIVRYLDSTSHVKEEKIRTMLREHFFDLEEEIRSREVRPKPKDLRQAIAWKREHGAILEQLPGKDCAACGAPDCHTLAEDVLAGDASLDDCVFIKIARQEAVPGAERKGLHE